jgi:hypothetical protein
MSEGLAVSVSALPEVSSINVEGSSVLCVEGDKSRLSITANAGTGIQWYRNGTAIAGAIASSYEAVEAGSYVVRLSNGRCWVETASVEVLSSRIRTVSITLHPMVEQQLRMGLATALYATEQRTGITYRWFKDGEEIAGANGRILLATRNGSYIVEVIDERTGCTLPSEAVSLSWPAGKEPMRDLLGNASERDLLNMSSELTQNWISAWPNPTQGQMTISISSELTEGEVAMQVLDFMGRPIFSGSMQENGEQLERMIDMSGLRKGLYYIQISDSRQVYRRTVKRE